MQSFCSGIYAQVSIVFIQSFKQCGGPCLAWVAAQLKDGLITADGGKTDRVLDKVNSLDR